MIGLVEMHPHICRSMIFCSGGCVSPICTVWNVLEMFLESEHDAVFGLGYILSLACCASDQVDDIIESACDFFGYYVGSPSTCTWYFPTKVQFSTFSACGHSCGLCGRGGGKRFLNEPKYLLEFLVSCGLWSPFWNWQFNFGSMYSMGQCWLIMALTCGLDGL